LGSQQTRQRRRCSGIYAGQELGSGLNVCVRRLGFNRCSESVIYLVCRDALGFHESPAARGFDSVSGF
jgi:hypothetical protein